MKNFSFARLLPHLFAILAFYFITLTYFYPEFVDGESLRQSDMMQYQGMVQENSKYLRENGEPSMWNGRMFSGMPAYMTYPIFPYGALPVFEAILRGGIPEQMAAHLLFLTMFCTYIMLLCFRTKPLWSAVGGVVFALTTYNLILIEVGHITKLWAIAYAALILGGMKLTFDRKYWLGFALTALGMALEVKASHYQITYYLGFICLIFGINELIFSSKNGKILEFVKQAGFLIVAFGLGVAVNAGKIMTTMEYSPYSTRGGTELTVDKTNKDPNSQSQSNEGLSKDYAFSWSQGIGETFTLLVPYLYGGSSSEILDKDSKTYNALRGQYSEKQLEELPLPLYHGDQPFTAAPIYAGAVLCFLFVWGMVVLDGREKWWILGAALFMAMLAWGDNFATLNYFLFDYIPGFNKFRSVSMALALTILLMTTLAFRAISERLSNYFLAGKEDKTVLSKNNDTKENVFLKNLFIATGITAGLCVLILLYSGSMNVSAATDAQLGQLADLVRQDRISMIRSSAFRSLFLIVLVAGAIYLYIKKTIPAMAAFALITLLAIGDVFLIGKDYLPSSKFSEGNAQASMQAAPVDTEIFKDKDLGYRVVFIQNIQQESRTSYFHRSLGGYFAAKMQRYQDLMERPLGQEQTYVMSSLQAQRRPDFSKTPVLNMLNARYVTYGMQKEQMLYNTNAFGTAWFVSKIKQVNNPDEEMTALVSATTKQEIDLSEVAILDKSKFEVSTTNFEKDSTATIKMTKYDSKVLEYESNNQNDGFAVFSEIYYPKGWIATIDGKEANIVSVNYVLRGLEIPKGKHKIVFTFESDSYRIGATITQISSWLVLLVVLVSFGLGIKNSLTPNKE
ncbi:YfhO family protein [Bernardetia sp.]|uniref:YfhO family protein n=1 Tax=Bernardetia sp. TaxID=1937974 RepID=UPI0025BE7160|nr:YfhO family protein [Bernardetia sp.]